MKIRANFIATLAILFVLILGASESACSQTIAPTLKLAISKTDSGYRDTGKRPVGIKFCRYLREQVEGLTEPKRVQNSEGGSPSFRRLKHTFTLVARHVEIVKLKKSHVPVNPDLDYYKLYIELNDIGKRAMFESFVGIGSSSYIVAIDEVAFPVEHFFRAKPPNDIRSRITLGYFKDRKFGEAFVTAVSPEPNKTKTRRVSSERLLAP